MVDAIFLSSDSALKMFNLHFINLSISVDWPFGSARLGQFQYPSNNQEKKFRKSSSLSFAGARGVVVIVVGNGHGDTSSNPGRD